MVRRLKEDIREVQGGFPKRIVERSNRRTRDDSPELQLSRLLDSTGRLREERLKRRIESKAGGGVVARVRLQQRLLSSIEAFARSLNVHRRTVVTQRERHAKAAAGDAAGLERTRRSC